MAGNLTAMIASIFSGSAVSTDPYFNLTTLLLSTTATNGQQNNTFQDSSTNNFTITRNPATGPNAPTQGTFSPFSQTGWGNYFNGSYLTVPSGADFNLGTNNFCIEFWLNPITPATYGGILSFDDGDYPLNFSYASANSSNLQANFGTTTAWLYTAFFDTSTATNEWAHYVATRSGSTFRLFKNGVLKATGTNSGTIGNSSNNIRINANGGSAGTTYISNLRIINGSIPTAYQTSSTTTGTTIFTVPTSPLTTTSQGATAADVKLLTCQSNRFVDNSTANPKTISVVTANSTPTVVPFSPFNPTSAWSASTVGGSGYFDGTGDYLTANDNPALELGSSNFCLEFMYYPTSSANTDFVTKRVNASSYGVIIVQTGLALNFWLSSSGSSWDLFSNAALGSVTLNAWNHLAIYRIGNAWYSSLNGTITTLSASLSGSVVNNAANWNIGGNNYASGSVIGYLSNFRLVIGSSVYTSTSAPIPTAPLTAVANTQLLLNFTNAGIYDATAKNVLETVGNAQVSTTTSQFPPTSMYFDGTGDYLPTNNFSNPLLSFGTGDFTIEYWAYASSGTNNGLFQLSDTAGGFKTSQANSLAMNIFTNNAVSIYANGTSYQAPNNTLPYNSWTHFAIVRSSNVTKLYANGSLITSIGSSGSITDNTNYTGTYIVVGGYYSTGYLFTGYIDDFRITRGYARYVTGTGSNANKMVFNGTNTLALPTAAFPVQ